MAIGCVKDYLSREFPGNEIANFSVPAKGALAHAFRLGDDSGAFLVEITHEFVRDVPADRIAKVLSDWNLSGELRKAGRGAKVMITRAGLALSV